MVRYSFSGEAFSEMLWKRRWLVLVFMPLMVVLLGDPSGMEWKYSHYLISYEDKFIRRGLIGTLAGLFSGTHSINEFIIFSYAMLFVVVLSFYYLVESLPRQWYFPAVFLFFLHPVLFRNYVDDLGRYDQIGIAFLFLVGGLLLRRQGGGLGLLLFSPVLILIHEAMLIWLLPTLTALFWLERGRQLDWSIVLCIAVWFALALLLMEYGGYSGSREELKNSMEQRSTSFFVDTSKHFLRSANDYTRINIDYLLAHPDKLYKMVKCWTAVFSVALLVKLTYVEKSYGWLALASAITPFFVLCIIGGIDYFRWISLSATLMLLWLVVGLVGGAIKVERRKYFNLWIVYPFIGTFGVS